MKLYGSVRVSRLVYVYDGDTIRVEVDGWPAIIGAGLSIRINGIDTPELRSKDEDEVGRAYEAKAFVVAALKGAQAIWLTNMQRGKYFRIVADVEVDGVNLAPQLIEAGLAVEYDGGTKV